MELINQEIKYKIYVLIEVIYTYLFFRMALMIFACLKVFYLAKDYQNLFIFFIIGFGLSWITFLEIYALSRCLFFMKKKIGFRKRKK